MLGQCLGIWTYNFRSLVFWIYSFSGILIMYILFGQVSNHWHSMSSFFLDSAPSYSSNMFFFALEATRLVGNLRFATLTYQRLNMVRTTPPVWGGIPPGQYTIRWNLELLKIRWFRFTTRLFGLRCWFQQKIYHGHGPFIMSTHQLRSKKRPIHVFPRVFFLRPKQKEVQNLDLSVFSVLNPRKTKKTAREKKKHSTSTSTQVLSL